MMKERIFKTAVVLAFATALLPLTGCLKGQADDYEEWRLKNEDFINSIDENEYTRVSPDWAPQNCVYIKWHNDRALTAGNMVAMSTSTTDIKYELEDIDGTPMGNSYSALDSIYRSTPNQNILGMWIAMTTMHVGDSATLIIPYPSGYGSTATNAIKPYTNLIYRVKIKSIKAFEKPED